MYVLTKNGRANLQGLTLTRLNPGPVQVIDVTAPWVPNVDPATGTVKVPESTKTAEVHANPIVLDGRGSGSQWELRADVNAGAPARLRFILIHEQSREIKCRFTVTAANGAATKSVGFTE